MEKGQLILCDTNIVIELYKGNPAIQKTLKSIGQENITVSIITAGELIYGALNKRELARIKKDIAHLQTLGIDDAVCDKFLTLMSTYALSHQLSLPDGFIAATALAHQIPLYSLNKKDFKYIKGLKLYEAG
ncbi:type II toxin-antitoxin system VapC family toxin [Fulvivirgaceae bacterium BMA12]|uniref:Ribonuclease VapC n=1 Tax=Agaribacillus aureus TaxID=3051825 RepID=A0ABT8KYZ5_9BACT|nr:type II toxin-antitoxin system VapC family toxin [Fulvivirgaceae bacterium BMA12]